MTQSKLKVKLGKPCRNTPQANGGCKVDPLLNCKKETASRKTAELVGAISS